MTTKHKWLIEEQNKLFSLTQLTHFLLCMGTSSDQSHIGSM